MGAQISTRAPRRLSRLQFHLRRPVAVLDEQTMQLNRDELRQAYRTMKLIREFEERLHLERPRGFIPGTVHLYAGQEASAVGVCMNLVESDWLASTHRGHGHSIAKGCDINAMMREIYGREGGLCKGKGGSMHIADLSLGMLGANGIVGGGPPLVCGAALTARVNKTGGVAVAFSGDGAVNEGATCEAFNLASVWKLPAVFVVEDNGFAEGTGGAWSCGGNLMDRARGFGLDVTDVDGTDFFEVHQKAKDVIAAARDFRPGVLVVRAKRFYGHFEGDAQKYRTKEELETTRRDFDPLKIFERRVIEAKLLETSELREIDNEIGGVIDASVEDAMSAPRVDARELTTDVYVSYR
jgi:pyruvate dehydrogenase E1 component alpha subunit